LLTWPGALAHDEAELGKVATERVDQWGSLTNRQVAGSEDYRRALSVSALGLDEAHRRALRCFADRLCVGHVVLLPLHERLHVRWRDEPSVVPKGGDLARPVARACAGFHGHHAAWLACEEGQHLLSGRPGRLDDRKGRKCVIQMDRTNDGSPHPKRPLDRATAISPDLR
jgi:hypothetical protein